MSARRTQDRELAGDTTASPERVRVIRDVETIRAFSDPLRLRMLEAMVRRPDGAWSVKELAAALEVPQTRLYHHVELLAAHDLIRPVERRVVSGIIETRYRVAALSFELDRRLFAPDTDEARAMLHETLGTVFDTARDEIERAVATGRIDTGEAGPEERRLLVSRGVVHVTPERAVELRRRLLALVDEFGADDALEGVDLGLVLAVYPLPAPEEDPDA